MDARAIRQQDGFTLIELLVIVITIGILAAIAIPIYLDSRDHAAEVAVKSDLRNGGTSAIVCATTNNPQGSFVGCDEAALVADYDWHQTADVDITVTTADADQWVAEAYHEQDSDQTVIVFDAVDGFQ